MKDTTKLRPGLRPKLSYPDPKSLEFTTPGSPQARFLFELLKKQGYYLSDEVDYCKDYYVALMPVVVARRFELEDRLPENLNFKAFIFSDLCRKMNPNLFDYYLKEDFTGEGRGLDPLIGVSWP